MASHRMGLMVRQTSVRPAALFLLLLLLLQSRSGSGFASNDDDPPTTTPANTSVSAMPFRLPRTVLPLHYDLYIETYLGDDAQGFKFKGHVAITLAATEPVQEIRLHAKDLELDKEAVQLSMEAGQAPAVSSIHLNVERDFLVIKLNGPLQPDIGYRLWMNFSAPLGEGLAGYYRSSYVERASGKTRWLAVTQFESTDARRAFPCFDEPSFKATFNISLAHHDQYSAVSNMPMLRSTPMEGRPDWTVDHFQRSLAMSTYLVAFMVSDFQHADSATSDNSTLFRVWARREALLQTGYASVVGPRILTFFERFFQVPYPLPKQDMVAIPDFNAGAMENWGLITYRERLLLFDQKVSSVLAKRDATSVIAHELAHQWFGNLVTMRWWSDLWLNEGFATYAATLGIHHVHPNWNSLEADALTNMLTVFKFDAMETSHPLSVKLENPAEIPQIFDTISYKKGSFLIRMMSHFLGEEVFRTGLTDYLQKHRIDNAEQDDLWEALTAAAHRLGALPSDMTVKAVMDTWTLQTGYPLLTVSREYNQSVVSISQHKYLAYQSSDPRRSKAQSCWEVPLTYASARAPQDVRRVWLHCEGGRPAQLTLTVDAGELDWLLLNVNSTGLFRVLYDAHGWELLGNALKEGDPSRSGLDRLSRAQLVEDALALAWTGDLPYTRAFSLLSYLQSEPDYLPWRAALNGLSSIYRLIRRTSSFGNFREFVVDLMEESLKTWANLKMPLDEDDLEGFRHRALMVTWACRLAVPSCVRQVTALFAEWMQQPQPDQNNPLPHGMQLEVTCTALKHGGEKEWAFAWDRYLASNVASERIELLQALCCAREPWLLQRLLEWSIQEGKGIRRQDSSTVFSGVMHNEYGFHIAKDFLFRNIARLHRFYGPKASRLSRYIGAVAEDMYTEQDMKEFDEFAKQNAVYLKQASLAVKQARDKISVNAEWMRSHYLELSQYLYERPVIQ